MHFAIFFIFLAFWATSLVLVVKGEKRQGNFNVEDLETLVQNQATTLQQLQARLDAQEQTISSLQSSSHYHTTQIASLQSAQRKEVGFLADFATHNGNVYLAPGEPVKFNFVVSNHGHAYNNITGIFTVPYTGLYAFFLQFMSSTHENYTHLGIYSGDRVHAVAYADGSNDDVNGQGQAFAVLHLAKGTEVTVKLVGGTGMIWGSAFTAFAGALIHAV